MNIRQWVHDQVLAEVGVQVSGRVFAANAQQENLPTPYVIHTLEFDEPSSSTPTSGNLFRVWAHDDGGYGLIDQILGDLKIALDDLIITEADGFKCEFVDASGDLTDDGSGTLTRYIRFLLTSKD